MKDSLGEINKMEEATEKQINALKKFAKNPELSKGLLEGVQFEGLDKEEARELIGKCYDLVNTNSEEEQEDSSFKVRFSQNYRNGDGKFGNVRLSSEELLKVREAHSQHCIKVMQECEEDYPADRELQLAMFDKKADKIFTWIQQALDKKVRMARK